MLRKIKLSVLTPIYKHDIRYVRECLESLRTQTIKEIEFVLIDNGASIEAKNLINEYQRKDERFRSIHLSENLGYGVALNCGLLEARGEYIGIVESDDSILPNMYQTLYNIASKYKCDVVKCDWISYLGKDSPQNSPRHNFPTEFCNKLITPREYPKLFLSDPAIWTGIYEKKFLKANDLKFIESPTARYQDTSFNFKVLALAQRAYFLDEQFVNYRRNTPNSSVKDLSAVFSLVEEYDEIENFLKNKTDIYQKLIYVKNYNKFRSYRWNYGRAQGNDKDEFLRKFKEDLNASILRRELDRALFSDNEIDWIEKNLGLRFFFFHNTNINISFAFDNNYYYQALVAIASLLDKAKGKVSYNFYLIISENVTNERKDFFRQYIYEKSPLSRVVFCHQNKVFDQGYEVRGITRTAYYRLLLHRILPDISHIIYSDVDVLFNSNLAELRNIPIERFAIAAVKDIAVNLKSNWEMLEGKFPYWRTLLKDRFMDYRNSGFLLINLDKFRELNFDNQIIEYSKMSLNYQDQDILNILFANNKNLICHLPPKYIFMPKHLEMGNYKKALIEHVITKKEYFQLICDPAIYHYAGPTKPWTNPEKKYNAQWCRYVRSNKKLRKHFNITCFDKKMFTTQKTNEGFKKLLLGKCFEEKSSKDGTTTHTHFWGICKTVRQSHEKKFYFMGMIILKKINDSSGTILKVFNIPIRCKRRALKIKEEDQNSRMEHIDTLVQKVQDLECLCNSIYLQLNNTKCIIEAQKIHPSTFGQYKGAFRNKDVVLVCTGPTAKFYIPMENAVHVGVNGAIYLDNVKLDYLFVQDYAINQKGNEMLLQDAFNYKGNICKKFFGVIPDEKLKSLSGKILRIPLPFSYDEHVSQYILEERIKHNIAYDLSINPMGQFEGTVFSALQFILFAHPKRLFLVGWDCGRGYAYAATNAMAPANYQIGILREHFLPFIKLNYPDIEIISVNPIGLRGFFKDVYTSRYSSIHPEVKNSLDLTAYLNL